MELIEYKNVYVGYEKDDYVLENVNFSIKKGTVTSLLGPNGTGKSTLMSTMNKLFKPLKGDIYIEGKDVKGMSQKEVAGHIAYVPQVTEAGFSFSVEEAIMWGRAPYISYLPRAMDYEIVDDVIRQFRIDHLKKKSFNSISGGERQMVLVARAIAQQSPIVLMDEPATYLDLHNQSKILNVIKEINKKQNVTFIVTLHDPNHAMYISDNVMLIKDKHVRLGTKEEMMTEEELEELYGIRCEVQGAEDDKYIKVFFGEE